MLISLVVTPPVISQPLLRYKPGYNAPSYKIAYAYKFGNNAPSFKSPAACKPCDNALISSPPTIYTDLYLKPPCLRKKRDSPYPARGYWLHDDNDDTVHNLLPKINARRFCISKHNLT